MPTGNPGWCLPLVLALIGTTIVPYNLFLHTNTALAKWGKGGNEGCQIDDRSREARLDPILAMALGGLVTCAIFTTAAMNIHGKGLDVKHPVETAQHLGAIFGGHQLFSLGLFAAGPTSSITAPLPAAYATCGCLGRSTEMRKPSMKWVVLAAILLELSLA